MTVPPATVDAAEFLNDHLDGWGRTMGLRYVRATEDEVVAEVLIDDRHRQAYGIVHGGVHSGLIETACSAGAALFSLRHVRSAVGLENSTSFLRAVREGRLTVAARPLTRGLRSQVWEATVRDERDRAVATGRVRLLCLEADASLAGERAALK